MKRIGMLLGMLVFVVSACGKGPVLIRSEPPRVQIMVNGVDQGVTPLELALDCEEEKSFEIVASAPGFLTQQETLKCRWVRGLENNVFFEMEPGVDLVSTTPVNQSPVEVIERYGILEVKSVPSGAQVFVGSMYVGDTPLLNKRIGAGLYTLEVRKDGFQTETRGARISADQESSYFVILESE